MLKEANEVLDLFDSLAHAVIEARKDGHVDWRDSPKLVPVLLDLKTAIAGLDLVSGEFKQASSDELKAYFQRSTDVALALVSAVLTKVTVLQKLEAPC